MPIIRIEGNKISKKKKREYFKEITEITAKYMDVPIDAVTIVYSIADHENIGKGGVLLSDKLKEGKYKKLEK